MKTILGSFALLLGAAFVALFAYAWHTLFQEHGMSAAPSVVAAHWQALALKSAIILLSAAAFGISGLHLMLRK